MHPLDNPIWQALTTAQSHFAEVCNGARKFPHEVSVLAGFSEPTDEHYHALATLAKPDEQVGLFLLQAPDPPAPWTIVSTGPLLQMVCEKPSSSLPARHRDGVGADPQFLRLS